MLREQVSCMYEEIHNDTMRYHPPEDRIGTISFFTYNIAYIFHVQNTPTLV